MVATTGLTLRFAVTLDGDTDLGKWTKCEGIGLEYEIHEFKEGGVNAYVHRLPGRLKYQTVKLTRPLDADSGRVAALVSKVAQREARYTAEIKLLDEAGQKVAAWSFVDVMVSKWNAPNLDVNGKEVAFETLEMVHNGFTGSFSGGA